MVHQKRHRSCWLSSGAMGIAAMMLISSPAQANNQVVELRGGSASLEWDDGTVEAVRVGTELWVGDWLDPALGTVVTVRCDNNTTAQVRYGAGLGRICPDSTVERTSNTGRGEDDFLSFLFGTLALLNLGMNFTQSRFLNE